MKIKLMSERTVFLLSGIVLTNILTSCTGPVPLTTCYNLVDSADYLQCAAQAGDKESQYQFGLEAFEAGNSDKAIKWLKRAAKKKREYYTSYSGNSDIATTLETGSYEPGHRGAQLLLVEIYEKGLGVKVNKRKAERYRNMSGN